MHFSTSPLDILQSDEFIIRYRDYGEENLPFDDLYVPPDGQAKLVLDRVRNSIILSFPFYDLFDVYKGVALFTVSASVLTDALAFSGRLETGGRILLCRNSLGFINGIPEILGDWPGSDRILEIISAIWDLKYRSIAPIVSNDSAFVLVSVRTDHGFYYGRIFNEAVLMMSVPVKTMIVIAVFLILFLIIFLLFNFRRDSVQTATYVLPGDHEKKKLLIGINPEEPIADDDEYGQLEELEPHDIPDDNGIHHSGGLLAAAESMAVPQIIKEQHSVKTSNVQIAFGDDDIPYIVESSGIELVIDDVGGTAFSREVDVIFVHNGVPYINNDLIKNNMNPETLPDDNFSKLVESVKRKN
jgi:hypothetical protein